ncbi:GNAT family N-acetyltransferase [Niveibacterium sp. SC-1]|uniref:GNAT family N-acetyltransferase n=1 Tax=Niveibacterium sp. SC-1 TaxID=3135646 RepID=UPI00311E398F
MSTATSKDIRDVTPDDLPELLRLVRGLAQYEKLEHLLQASVEDYRDALFGPRPVAEAVMAFVDERAVGFALFFQNYSTFLGKRGLYLEDLFVEPEFRGRGLGQALIRRVAALAVERQCGRFEWSVLDWNAPAIAFYEKLGATVLPDWRIVRATGDSLSALAAG